MEKLKVGDVVVRIQPYRLSNFTEYRIGTVERLTPTLAVLSNGDKLVNQLRSSGEQEFMVKGNPYSKRYQLLTPEIHEQAKIENKRIKAHNWFEIRKFTQEEKEMIYDHFLNLNIL